MNLKSNNTYQYITIQPVLDDVSTPLTKIEVKIHGDNYTPISNILS